MKRMRWFYKYINRVSFSLMETGLKHLFCDILIIIVILNMKKNPTFQFHYCNKSDVFAEILELISSLSNVGINN